MMNVLSDSFASAEASSARTNIADNSRVEPNPFLVVTLQDGFVRCRLLLERREYEIDAPMILQLFAWIGAGVTWKALAERGRSEGLSRLDMEDTVRELHGKGILRIREAVASELDAKDAALVKAARHWVDRGWLEALIFHLETRSVPFDDDEQPAIDSLAIATGHANSLMRGALAPEIWLERSDGIRSLPLPVPASFPQEPLIEVLLRRRSNRPWTLAPLSAAEISAILDRVWSDVRLARLRMQMETAQQSPTALLRSLFSAFEMYVLAFDVDGLEQGLYHFDMKNAALTMLRPADLRKEAVAACIGQERAGTCRAMFVLTARWERFMFRYQHSRAFRTLLINTGEVGQRLLVAATALNYATFMTPAFRDEEMDALLGVRSTQESALYAVCIG